MQDVRGLCNLWSLPGELAAGWGGTEHNVQGIMGLSSKVLDLHGGCGLSLLGSMTYEDVADTRLNSNYLYFGLPNGVVDIRAMASTMMTLMTFANGQIYNEYPFAPHHIRPKLQSNEL